MVFADHGSHGNHGNHGAQRSGRSGFSSSPFQGSFSSDNQFLSSSPIGLDLRTSIDETSRTAQFNSNFDQGFDQGDFGIDSLGAPAPFPTSAPTTFVDQPSFGSSSSRNFVSDASKAPAGIDFSQAQRTADGRLCVIKESSVETIAKDPILECTHKNVQKCHYTYVTQFTSAQEEVCEENFEKLCQITFKQQATRETVKKCYRPQKKVCNGQGPTECRTVYESSCTTRYVEKQRGNDTVLRKFSQHYCTISK